MTKLTKKQKIYLTIGVEKAFDKTHLLIGGKILWVKERRELTP